MFITFSLASLQTRYYSPKPLQEQESSMTLTSRSHQQGQYGPNPTTDQKIEIFRERVLGNQVEVAEEMAQRFNEAVRTNDSSNPMRHCGFAIVSVVFPYFETIAQCIRGASSRNRSKQFFDVGFREVYPATPLTPQQIGWFYEDIRCWLDHNGTICPGTNLYEGHTPTFSIDSGGQLLLNPVTLVQDIKRHFAAYIKRLEDPTNVQLRHNFEATFSRDVTIVSQTLTQSYHGSGSGY